MNRVLVTGMALGKEVDACQACNFDLSWLVQYPSVLLWTDKIIITQAIWEIISRKAYPSKREEVTSSIKLIFDMLQSQSLIEIVDPTTVITPEIKDLIFEEIDKDRKVLPDYFPELIKLGDEEKVPGQIFIGNHEYCSPYLWGVYAALLLARSWKAESLFGPQIVNYIKYKFGATSLANKGTIGKSQSFNKIFEAYFPNIPVLPSYAINKNRQCTSCVHIDECKHTYLLEIEKRMSEVLKWRNYDEIQQIKSVIQRIINAKENAGDIIDPDEILAEFKEEQLRVQRKINKIFPKIKRWANLSTMLSIPVAITGLSSGSMPITIGGAAIAGISQVTKEAIDYMCSKYNWLAFINSSHDASTDKKVGI